MTRTSPARLTRRAVSRQSVVELPPREQRRCRHPRWGFVALRTANGVEQIRKGCPDCGHRELHNYSHSEHPARHTYPVITKGGTGPRAIGDYAEYRRTEAWLERRARRPRPAPGGGVNSAAMRTRR